MCVSVHAQWMPCCTCVAISYELLWRLITQGKQGKLVNNAVLWLVPGMRSCDLLETTNGTHHGEHEQRAQRSQPDNDAITRLRGHITQCTTLSALVRELHQQVPIWCSGGRNEWFIKEVLGCWVAIFQSRACSRSLSLRSIATALAMLFSLPLQSLSLWLSPVKRSTAVVLNTTSTSYFHTRR